MDTPVLSDERNTFRRTAAWLIAGLFFAVLTGADHPVALAAWLAPICLVRFVRMQRFWIGMAGAWTALAAAIAVTMNGMVPMPAAAYAILVALIALMSVLPLAIDRLIFRRLPAWAGTLTFPLAQVAVQALGAGGPYGTWGTQTYSQIADAPLMQSLSVAGLWGVVFLIGWVAAVANLALARGFASRAGIRALAAAAMVLTAVLLGGEIRLALADAGTPTVRIAGVSASADIKINKDFKAAKADLFDRSAREADAGAKIVFWSEGAIFVPKAEEVRLIAEGKSLAARKHIYLGMAMAVWTDNAPKPLENTLVLITPEGNIGWRYIKSRPVPGPEANVSVPGSMTLPVIDTPYGRIAGAICFDADFPKLIAQAGRAHADILIVPANDWRDITPLHTQMASARAIEQGVNLFRQVSNGYSAAYDAYGRPLAGMDAYRAKTLATVAQVPTKRVRTLYAALGDWLVWLSLAGLIGLIGWTIIHRPEAAKRPLIFDRLASHGKRRA